MTRKIFTALGVFMAIALAGSCHSSDNTVTGPVVVTPAPGAPAPTSPPSATPTPMPSSGQTATVSIGQGGANAFADQKSGTTTTTIRVGDTVNWVWASGLHSTTSGSCPGGICQATGMWDSGAVSGTSFSHTFTQAGTFPYHCVVHGAMMQGTVVVQ